MLLLIKEDLVPFLNETAGQAVRVALIGVDEYFQWNRKFPDSPPMISFLPDTFFRSQPHAPK